MNDHTNCPKLESLMKSLNFKSFLDDSKIWEDSNHKDEKQIDAKWRSVNGKIVESDHLLFVLVGWEVIF